MLARVSGRIGVPNPFQHFDFIINFRMNISSKNTGYIFNFRKFHEMFQHNCCQQHSSARIFQYETFTNTKTASDFFYYYFCFFFYMNSNNDQDVSSNILTCYIMSTQQTIKIPSIILNPPHIKIKKPIIHHLYFFSFRVAYNLSLESPNENESKFLIATLGPSLSDVVAGFLI